MLVPSCRRVASRYRPEAVSAPDGLEASSLALLRSRSGRGSPPRPDVTPYLCGGQGGFEGFGGGSHASVTVTVWVSVSVGPGTVVVTDGPGTVVVRAGPGTVVVVVGPGTVVVTVETRAGVV